MQRLFQDPAWWMTAVVLALALNVVANFITQGISKALARFSPTFRQWRERRQTTFVSKAEDLARDFGLILFHYLWGIGMLITWSTTFTFLLAFVIVSKLAKDHPRPVVSVVVFLGISILSLFAQIQAFGAFRLANKARQIYKKKILPAD